MKLRSPAFEENARIPEKYVKEGAGGLNVSPPLAWEDVPAGTRSLALSIHDPHPVANNWVHWLVIDIPADATGLPDGASGARAALPEGALELDNGFSQVGCGGPQPPPGSGDHPYVCTIYALNVPHLALPQRPGWEEFKAALKPAVLDQASTTATYGR